MSARSNRQLFIAAFIVVVLIVVVANLIGHRKNRYERMADSITQALARNDMAPVQKDFNAVDRPQLQDRERVGHLSNLVVSMGTFKGSKETTPRGSDPNYHSFVETFAKGTLAEKFQLDPDGKITRFHIGPSASANPGS
ncbi:MAG: hypothetical protein GIX03_09265 [Candidatus Eremiobacteraeota bacterium]|nr:hypothetical protein [Candidatus Eremiobacteraeota bacterium]MBC5803162.1 hypothetical protein [Candidatus Eremiobacteraeota bacterium]MBC5822963.1 hypothetical protein [Candidatus Eremiobacteraeota bacterium]